MKFSDEVEKKILNKGVDVSDTIHAPLGKTVLEPFGYAYSEYTQSYTNYLYPTPDRIYRYRELEDMDTYDTYISTALDIYADSCVSKDLNSRIISVKGTDKKIRLIIEKLFFDKIGIEDLIWDIVRNTCHYGDSFFEIVFHKDLKGIAYLMQLNPYSVVRIEDAKTGSLIGFVQHTMIQSSSMYQDLRNLEKQSSPIRIPPSHIVHFRLWGSKWKYKPYGVSILDKARRLWRIIRLIEDAMLIYRVTRAPERRVFKIPVPKMMTPSEKEQYIKKVIDQFRKKPFVNFLSNEIDKIPHIMPPEEDFYIPIPEDGGVGAEIDTLPGASNLDEIDDIRYFRDRLFAALRIPRIYLQDPEGGTENRRQNLVQQDIHFARLINRIQKQITIGLTKIAALELLLNDFSIEDLNKFNISFASASLLEDMLKSDMMSKKREIVENFKEMGIPRVYTIPNILDFSYEEYLELEKINSLEDEGKYDEIMQMLKSKEVEEKEIVKKKTEIKLLGEKNNIVTQLLVENEIPSSVKNLLNEESR